MAKFPEKKLDLNFRQAISGSGINPSATDKTFGKDALVDWAGLKKAGVDVDSLKQSGGFLTEQIDAELDSRTLPISQRNADIANNPDLNFNDNKLNLSVSDTDVQADFDLSSAWDHILADNNRTEMSRLEDSLYVDKNRTRILTAATIERNENNEMPTDYTVGNFAEDFIVPLTARAFNAGDLTGRATDEEGLQDLLNNGSQEAREAIYNVQMQMLYNVVTKDKRLFAFLNKNDPAGMDKLAATITERNYDASLNEGALRYPVIAGKDEYGKTYIVGEEYKRLLRTKDFGGKDKGFWGTLISDRAIPKAASQVAIGAFNLGNTLADLSYNTRGEGDTEQVLRPYEQQDVDRVISYNQNVTTWNRSINYGLTESAAKLVELTGAAVSSAYRGQTLAKSFRDFWQPTFNMTAKDLGEVANFLMKLAPGDSEDGVLGYKIFSEEVLNDPNLTAFDIIGQLPVTLQDRIMYSLADTAFGRNSEFGVDADLDKLRKAGVSASQAVRPGTRMRINEATGKLTSEGIESQLADLPAIFASIGVLARGTEIARRLTGVVSTKKFNMAGRGDLPNKEILEQAFSKNKRARGYQSNIEISVPINRSLATRVLDSAFTKARVQSPINSLQLQMAMYGGAGASMGARNFFTNPDGTTNLTPAAMFFIEATAGLIGGFTAFPLTKSTAQATADVTGATNLFSNLFNDTASERTVREASRKLGISFAEGKRHFSDMSKVYAALEFEDPDTFQYLLQGQKEATEVLSKLDTELSTLYPDPKNPVRVAILNALEGGIQTVITLDSMKGAHQAVKNNNRKRKSAVLNNKKIKDALEQDENQAAMTRESSNLENSLIETLAIVGRKFAILEKEGVSTNSAEQIRKYIQSIYEYTAAKVDPTAEGGKSAVLDAFIAAVDIRDNLKNNPNTPQAEATAIKKLNDLYANLNEEERNVFVGSLLDNEKLFQGADEHLRPYVKNLWEEAIPEVKNIITTQRNEIETFRQSTFDGTPIATANMDSGGRPLPREVSPDASGRAQYNVLQSVYDALDKLVTEKYDIAFAAGGNRTLSFEDIIGDIDTVKTTATRHGLKAAAVPDAIDSALQRASAEYRRLRKIDAGDLEDDGGILGVSDFTLKELHSIASSIEKQAYKLADSDPAKAAVMYDVAAIFRKPLKEEALSNKNFGKALNDAKNLFQAVIADPFKNPGLRKKMRDAKTENIILQMFSGPDARKNYDAVMEELGKTKDKNGVVIGPALQANLEKAVKGALLKDFFAGKPNMSPTDRFNRLRKLERGADSTTLEKHDAYKPKTEGGFLDLLLGEGKDIEFAQRNSLSLVLGSRGEIKYDESMALHGNTLDANNTALLKSLIVTDNEDENALRERVNNSLGRILPVLLDEDNDISDNGMANFLRDEGKKADVDLAMALAKKITDDSKIDPIDPSASAVTKFEQTVEAVRKVSGDKDADEFELNLKDYIGRRLLSTLQVKKENDVEGIVKGVETIKQDFATLKGFYNRIYGSDEADAMEAFLYIKHFSEQEHNLLMNATGVLGEMSPTMILSRAWGVARNVVSPRYVVSEYLIRRFISRNQVTIDQFIGDPKVSSAFMKLIVNQEPLDLRSRRYIKSQVTAILLEGAEDEEERGQVINSINDMYKQLVNDNEDPELAVLSLMLATLNKPFMISLEEDARVNTAGVVGVRDELTAEYADGIR